MQRDLTLLEAIRAVTARDMRNLIDEEYAASINTAIFVPSPHIGPYLTWHRESAATWVLFGARMPQQETANGAARLNTFEMLNGVEALADATRLEILQMLARRGEMSTQEIMDAFQLTKSTASRHLRQLSATGLLGERRESGAAKVYHVKQRCPAALAGCAGRVAAGRWAVVASVFRVFSSDRTYTVNLCSYCHQPRARPFAPILLTSCSLLPGILSVAEGLQFPALIMHSSLSLCKVTSPASKPRKSAESARPQS